MRQSLGDGLISGRLSGSLIVAEKLGLNQDEIRFLDLRQKNPVEALLIFITNQRPAERPMNVGELYNILCECGIPVIADKL